MPLTGSRVGRGVQESQWAWRDVGSQTSQTETEREKNNKNRRDDNENETSMLSGIISEGVKCEYLEYQKEKEKNWSEEILK